MAKVYGIIPNKEGGYILAATEYAEDVQRVNTETLVRMQRKDSSLHFVSFAFEEIDMMHEKFNDKGELESFIGHHLVPVSVWGSVKTGEHVVMMLDGSDFKKFETHMETRGAMFDHYLCMDGLRSMSQDNAKDWHTKLEVAK